MWYNKQRQCQQVTGITLRGRRCDSTSLSSILLLGTEVTGGTRSTHERNEKWKVRIETFEKVIIRKLYPRMEG